MLAPLFEGLCAITSLAESGASPPLDSWPKAHPWPNRDQHVFHRQLNCLAASCALVPCPCPQVRSSAPETGARRSRSRSVHNCCEHRSTRPAHRAPRVMVSARPTGPRPRARWAGSSSAASPATSSRPSLARARAPLIDEHEGVAQLIDVTLGGRHRHRQSLAGALDRRAHGLGDGSVRERACPLDRQTGTRPGARPSFGAQLIVRCGRIAANEATDLR